MKKFYDFGGGVPVSDADTNVMIKDCLKYLTTKDRQHYSWSTGDTAVIGLVYESGSICITVANSTGRSTIDFYNGDSSDFVPYSR